MPTASMPKRRLSEQQRRRIAHRRSPLQSGGGSESTSAPAAEGLVIANLGQRLEVEDPEGHRYGCHLRANLPTPVPGDKVLWVPPNRPQDQGVIESRLPRRNALERPGFDGALKPIAANIDQVVLVMALDPEPLELQIDRHLIAIAALGAEALVVINKIDLVKELPQRATTAESLGRMYRALGYATLAVSSRQVQGMADLRAALRGRISVVVGASGVGKSALIQTLLPHERLRTGTVSAANARGKHTTTNARLYHLPEGGQLIDSPGIREFGLGHLDVKEIYAGFVELAPALGHCRFRSCTHQQEPGCALREYIRNGAMAPSRRQSLERILRERGLGGAP
ncbi:MAG: ribosome small subunit-dependent GTPase A [Pseudomonadota bacterium]|nr:ribosome small subunit-dependent GTPase A [Pseudomonadota bacterium]